MDEAIQKVVAGTNLKVNTLQNAVSANKAALEYLGETIKKVPGQAPDDLSMPQPDMKLLQTMHQDLYQSLKRIRALETNQAKPTMEPRGGYATPNFGTDDNPLSDRTMDDMSDHPHGTEDGLKGTVNVVDSNASVKGDLVGKENLSMPASPPLVAGNGVDRHDRSTDIKDGVDSHDMKPGVDSHDMKPGVCALDTSGNTQATDSALESSEVMILEGDELKSTEASGPLSAIPFGKPSEMLSPRSEDTAPVLTTPRFDKKLRNGAAKTKPLGAGIGAKGTGARNEESVCISSESEETSSLIKAYNRRLNKFSATPGAAQTRKDDRKTAKRSPTPPVHGGHADSPTRKRKNVPRKQTDGAENSMIPSTVEMRPGEGDQSKAKVSSTNESEPPVISPPVDGKSGTLESEKTTEVRTRPDPAGKTEMVKPRSTAVKERRDRPSGGGLTKTEGGVDTKVNVEQGAKPTSGPSDQSSRSVENTVGKKRDLRPSKDVQGTHEKDPPKGPSGPKTSKDLHANHQHERCQTGRNATEDTLKGPTSGAAEESKQLAKTVLSKENLQDKSVLTLCNKIKTLELSVETKRAAILLPTEGVLKKTRWVSELALGAFGRKPKNHLELLSDVSLSFGRGNLTPEELVEFWTCRVLEPQGKGQLVPASLLEAIHVALEAPSATAKLRTCRELKKVDARTVMVLATVIFLRRRGDNPQRALRAIPDPKQENESMKAPITAKNSKQKHASVDKSGPNRQKRASADRAEHASAKATSSVKNPKPKKSNEPKSDTNGDNSWGLNPFDEMED